MAVALWSLVIYGKSLYFSVRLAYRQSNSYLCVLELTREIGTFHDHNHIGKATWFLSHTAYEFVGIHSALWANQTAFLPNQFSHSHPSLQKITETLSTVSPAIHIWTVGSLSQMLRPCYCHISPCKASCGGLIHLIPLALNWAHPWVIGFTRNGLTINPNM